MGTATGQLLEDNPEIVSKLEIAYSMGCTDTEACLFAGISTATLHYYIKNIDPSFSERKENLKLNPILNAKTTVTDKLKSDVNTAKWYLERKTKEFKPPDKNTNIQLNQLNLLTESQIKDRLAHKLSKLLTDHNEPVDHNDLNVIDVDSNTVDSDDMDT